MNAQDLRQVIDATVFELAGSLASKTIKAEEIVLAAIERTHTVEPVIHAFITIDEEGALERAREVDAARARGEELPRLAGIPIAIKDNMCTEGLRTTAGSRMLSSFVPPYDAGVVERVKAAGLVIVGKTNMDEFAMGSSTETSYFGATRNPWNTGRVAGGTSGGSAAAVAADEVPVALGSDTGGSIRQPAAFCGVVGLKPTYGRVSRYGLIAYVSSFDQIGVLARDTRDCALVTEVIAGHDSRDSTSIERPVPRYSEGLNSDVRGLRLGLPREYMTNSIEPSIRAAIEKTIRCFEELGAHCEETSLPMTPYAVPAYYVIATSEASSNLARYDGVRFGFRGRASTMWEMMERSRGEGFGAEVKRRILLGTFALSAGYYDAYYLQAQKVRTLIRQDYEKAFQLFDALIMPCSPFAAFGIGEKIQDPMSMYLADVHTVGANMAGVPGLSVPVDLNEEGLPIGVQLQGPPFSEQLLLTLGHALEQALGSFPRPKLTHVT
jgi:aspartyl-tRNA(Asn)/glutamyl-tRNA(Gln) amidotransferase subunit A